MEILIEILTSVVEKIGECTIAPIGHQLGYIFYYKRNISNLKSQIQLVQVEKEKLQHLIDEATNRGEEIEKNVQDWQNKVSDIINKSQDVLKELEGQVNTRCWNGLSPNLISRHQQGRKAKKMAEDVANEIEEARKIGNNKISFHSVLHNSIENKSYETFTSRISTLRKIMDALKDPNISKIGVYGMAGAGKTMLANEVGRQAKEQNLFDVVILVPISKSPNFEKIQQIIADHLALEFFEKDVTTKASRLRDQLTKQKKKILIILDDVWEKLALYDVGICFRDDQKESKILLTTRFEDVCNVMDIERNFLVGVLSEDESKNLFNKIVGSSIKNYEVHDLANDIVKECAGLPLAITTIANALKGKKLAVWKDFLRALKKSSLMEIHGMEGNVYSSIKLSYDYLDNEDARSVLVFCSLHKEDEEINVDLLWRYGLGFGLFKYINEVEEVKEKVFSLVDYLKSSSLLLDGQSLGFVKMHDIVRDVVISIASEEKHMHIIEDIHVKREEFLPKYRDSIGISILKNNNDPLPEELVCPRLKLLFLFGSYNSSSEIPENFFNERSELRVLLLKFIGFERPHSYFPPALQNLQTLCLNGCKLQDITSIGKLNNLKILDLAGSNIEKLPKEIGQLTKLKLLDLSYCGSLKSIEPNVLSRLKNLEELNMIESFSSWVVDEVDGERSNASIVELCQLQLSTLYIRVRDAKVLPKKKWLSENLKRYEILIGDYWLWNWDVQGTSRRLGVDLYGSIQLDEYKIKTLLKTSEELCLRGLVGIRDVIFGLDENGLSQLKFLEFGNNDDVKYIANSMDQIHVSAAFPKLESLSLYGLMNLEKICNGKFAAESFGKLRTVQVENCGKLKYLLPLSIAKRLESITINTCNMMEEIIGREEDYAHNIINEDIDHDKVEFPQLYTLSLCSLPQFKRFFSNLKMTSTAKRTEDPIANPFIALFNRKVSFPILRTIEIGNIDNLKHVWTKNPQDTYIFQNLKDINVFKCPNLESLFPTSVTEGLLQLQRLTIRDCEMLKEIVSEEEEGTETKTMPKFVFPQLTNLSLYNLPQLVSFYPGLHTSEWPLLKYLSVQECMKLTVLAMKVSSRMKEERISGLAPVNNQTQQPFFLMERVIFPKLEELKLRSVALEEILDQNVPEVLGGIGHEEEWVAFPILRTIDIGYIDNLKKIWEYPSPSTKVDYSFHKLEMVEIRGCKHLQKILPSPMWPRLLPNLTELKIIECEMVEEVFEIEISNVVEETTNQLKILMLVNLVKLKNVWTKNPQDTHIFQNLKDIEVAECPNLESLFPTSVAKGLLQLQSLIIRDCEMLKEIVSEEEEGTETKTMPKFVFPQLTELRLNNLPQLVSFYLGLHTSEWPLLKQLEVNKCMKVTVLAMKVSSRMKEERIRGLAPVNNQTQQPFFSMERVSFPILRTIEIGSIDNLKKICEYPQDTHIFQNLKDINVFKCPNLESLFPTSVAKGLLQLQSLTIRDCEMLKEIVSEEEAGTETKTMPKFVFPQLTNLSLYSLPQLMSFYPGLHTSEWPLLEHLAVNECMKVTVLAMKVSSRMKEERISGLAPVNNQTQQPFFLMEMVIFPKLKGLTLRSVAIEEILDQDLFEVLGSTGHEEEWVNIFPSLRRLKLNELPRLMKLWEDKYSYVFQNLQTLVINECGSLMSLVPFSMSFRNLTILRVSKCHGLRNLVTLQIARSLGQNLTNIDIHDCQNMTEIIAKEGGEDAMDEDKEIIFPKLEHLILYKLPNLTSFYNGNCIMRFPNLEITYVWACPEMQRFCIHGAITQKLNGVNKAFGEQYTWKGDINKTLEDVWKRRHINPLTTTKQEEDSTEESEKEEDLETKSEENFESSLQDDSEERSRRDSKEDSEQDLEGDTEKSTEEDSEQEDHSEKVSEEDSSEDSDEDSKKTSEEDSRNNSEQEDHSEKVSKEDSSEDSDEDSNKTSEEDSKKDSEEDLRNGADEEDSEEIYEEDSKQDSEEDSDKKDLKDDTEEKSFQDSSEDTEEDFSHSEQNSEEDS